MTFLLEFKLFFKLSSHVITGNMFRNSTKFTDMKRPNDIKNENWIKLYSSKELMITIRQSVHF